MIPAPSAGLESRAPSAGLESRVPGDALRPAQLLIAGDHVSGAEVQCGVEGQTALHAGLHRLDVVLVVLQRRQGAWSTELA